MFDRCVLDLCAKDGIDPVADLSETEFVVAYTPDLKFEYLQALSHSDPSPETKELIRKILSTGTLHGFFGFAEEGATVQPYLGWGAGVWADPSQSDVIASIATKENKNGPIPRNRTDAVLVAFAKDAIVITSDKGAHWRRAPEGAGRVIHWDDLKKVLAEELNLASAIRRILATGKS
jgi:hypothetical protein